jgi:hypothetical protein
MTEDETLRTIRAWVQDDAAPPEEQIKRLRQRIERLESRVGAERRKSVDNLTAWTRIFAGLLAACLLLACLALWSVLSYEGAQVALKDVCKFVAREAVTLPNEAVGLGKPVDTLEGANDVCSEQDALPR